MSWTDEKIEELLYREGLVIAPLFHRLGSYFVDSIFVILLGFFVCLLTSDLNSVEAQIFFIQKIFFSISCFSLLYEIFFVYFYGSSLGKMLFKLRVVSLKTLDTPIFKDVLRRSLLKAFEGSIGWILLIFVFDNKFFRALHDRFSKTIVVVAW